MRNFKFYLTLVLFSIGLQGCNDILKQTTTLQIIDNNRKYYPILNGETLEVVFDVRNSGPHPFILSEIFTSCGCLLNETKPFASIAPGEVKTIRLKYDSSKNVGATTHYVTLYGNLKEPTENEFEFHVNVVPQSQHLKDYEELYQERSDTGFDLRKWVDGDKTQKPYYFERGGKIIEKRKPQIQ
ncbi:DUF1573 domain-containing protein [Planobacterium oryzisoli]|uniref:DUF1573 domain-containing protein n=1 Tax=Planobacterium oryzisoli TaxID=2771435 RepID=A0A930YW77_9FLAO|nr:DUF1573 domain-containing protein [Planobacterium oryzisoli]MBF5027552.1 DUF1573 domain-containing protein [Planobacterium oryzisoli]